MKTNETQRTKMQGKMLGAVVGLGMAAALLVGACNSGDDTVTPYPHNANFGPTEAEEEGYWYSRYNLGNLVMRSGLGETFMPEMAMMQQMIAMVDANPDDGDTVMVPANVTLLKSIYRSGDPHYQQQMNVDDFGTQRWDESTFDKTVTTRSMAWTIIKESEWAKQFHVDDHFGTPTDDFGAQWRFVGMVMNASAKMQTQYAMQMMMNGDGLYKDTDGSVDQTGQWVLLEAFSDLASTLGAQKLPNSDSNRYLDTANASMILGAADALYAKLSKTTPSGNEALSLAIQSLTWYAASTANAANKTEAINLIQSFADTLGSDHGQTATDKAFSVRGLIEAYRVSGQDKYLQHAAMAFNELLDAYDSSTGAFTSQSAYSIDDVGVILGAINAVKIFAGSAVDQDKTEALFTAFFESAVNLSGLQQAVPAKTVAKGDFELDEPDLYYGYPGIPKPPMAGGPFGIAPVFAGEVSLVDGKWQVTDGRFYAAGAMHTSNEMIWFHNDEVNGFPTP